jgi:hypothetical protein
MYSRYHERFGYNKSKNVRNDRNRRIEKCE